MVIISILSGTFAGFCVLLADGVFDAVKTRLASRKRKATVATRRRSKVATQAHYDAVMDCVHDDR